MSEPLHDNADPAELGHFHRLADQWWDPHGALRTLHQLNPTRLAYIVERCGNLRGRSCVDVGCGGGILSEGLAAAGAEVTGIDLAASAIDTARLHLHESGLRVDYRQISAEQLAAERPGGFRLVTCLEMLEHVPDPAAIIAACAGLAAPGGDLIFSTLNRTPRAYALAVLGAEYIAQLLPRGTHDYARFIRPAELAGAARASGLELLDLRGLAYNPLTRRARLVGDVGVNYLAHLRRPADVAGSS